MKSKVSNSIYFYISSDVLSLASYRLFQVFCTWYYIQNSNQEEILANVMLLIWLSSLFFLPISGSILEKCRKTIVLLVSCLVTCLVSAALMFYFILSDNDNIYVVLLITSVILSAASSFLMPLGVSLIPEISSNDKETAIGIRMKSSTFIINLILGPMLGGFLVGYFGGTSILITSFIFSFLSIITSLSLVIKNKIILKKDIHGSFISGLKKGLIRTLMVKEERIISIISSLSNLFLVPFLFLLLPSKIIASGYTMFEVSLIEVCIGIGMLLSPSVILPYAEKLIGKHALVCLGQLLIALSLFSFSLTNTLHVQYILGFCLGVGLNLFNVVINTSRSISIPNGYRAPMEASFLLFCTIVIPFGFWISKQYIGLYSIDLFISLSLFIYIPSLLVLIYSNDIKELVNHKSGDTPYYKEKYKNLFNEVN